MPVRVAGSDFPNRPRKRSILRNTEKRMSFRENHPARQQRRSAIMVIEAMKWGSASKPHQATSLRAMPSRSAKFSTSSTSNLERLLDRAKCPVYANRCPSPLVGFSICALRYDVRQGIQGMFHSFSRFFQRSQKSKRRRSAAQYRSWFGSGFKPRVELLEQRAMLSGSTLSFTGPAYSQNFDGLPNTGAGPDNHQLVQLIWPV